jgi:predicted outer membrane repeat protein
MTSTCVSSGGHNRPMTNSIYHACGNGSGMHWQPQDNSEKVSFANANTNINLWVRANPSAALVPLIGTLNGFKVGVYDGTQKYLKRDNTNLNPRSTFVTYSDSSTASCVPAITSSAAGAIAINGPGDHGIDPGAGCGNTSLHSDWSATAVVNGSNWKDGVASNFNTTPRLTGATPSILSRIFTANLPATTTWWLGTDRAAVADRYINGRMAEVMVYSSAVNKAQRIILENYMAAKFNTTLTGQVYTYGGASTHKYEMAGIGQADDSSAHIKAKGGAVQISNPVGMAINEYVMWAHDNAPMAFQNSELPPLIGQRIGREWRVRNVNVTSMDVGFHIYELPGFLSMCFDPNNMRLLVDNDGNFGNGGTTVITGVYDAATQVVNYTNVTIPNGSFISFGTGGIATTVYVAPKAKGLRDGSSWANACTLEGAISSPRLIGDTIKVSQGLYKPTSTITLLTGINIIGGYEGLSTLEVSQPSVYQTVISGDRDNNDEALGNFIMYHRDIQGSNLSRLFMIANIPNPVTLQGFTITGMSTPTDHAGAIWQQNTVVNYNNMKFYGNRAREMGGSILVFNSATANITDSEFLGNAGEAGGAINAHVNATVNVTNTLFTNNQSLFLNNRGNRNRFAGAAIDANQSSTIVVTGSTFSGNNAFNINDAAAIKGYGGAISLTQNAANDPTLNNSSLTVTNSTFSFNLGRDGGGAIYAMPGFNVINISNTDFIGNGATRKGNDYSGSGGAINVKGSTVSTAGKNKITITDSEFEKNWTNELGGAIFTGGGVDYSGAAENSYLTVEIMRSAFIANTAGFGGGMFSWWFGGNNHTQKIENSTFAQNIAGNYGGGVAAVNGADLIVNHSTFYGNMAGTDGGGIKVRDAGSDVTIKNSLLVGNIANAGQGSVNDGTAGKPFTSLQQARWWMGTGYASAGVYNFNISGNAFTSYVDANGWVLVASSNGTIAAGAGMTQVSAMSAPPMADRILTSTILAVLDINQIRINSPASKLGNFDMTSSNATNIARLKANQTLGNNFDLGAASWSGTHDANMTSATCTDWVHASPILSNNILGHCGNGTNGFHWQGHRGNETVTWATQAPADSMNLWVRNGSLSQGRGDNIENSVAITANTATSYNMIGFNGKSGWQNLGTTDQALAAPNLVSPATVITNIIDTTLDNNGGLTRNLALSTNGGAGSSAFNRIPIADCLPNDQRSELRLSSGAFIRCDMGAYESVKTDSDGDGIINAVDNCPNVSNADQLNTDRLFVGGDNLGDVCDPDDDADGVLDEDDFFPLIPLNGRLDSDGDGIPNVCLPAPDPCGQSGMFEDTDADGDGIPNVVDNCPTTPNVDQNDVDGDGMGDACDADLDGDGVDNDDDNCPGVSNPLQVDSDGNGLGDACNAVFIKPVASGLGDGSSWNNAYGGGTGTQLADAINAAADKSATLIYMAEGIYRPSATIDLRAGVQIYGGFKGVDETYHYQARPEENLTIITGDAAGTPDILDANGITQLYTQQIGTNLAQIFNANSQGTSTDSTISMTGLIVTGAGSNSALHVKNARVRLNKMKFLGNKGVSGGALFMEENAFAVVSDTTFSGNQSSNGGAVYLAGLAGVSSEATIYYSTFTGNKATGAGSAGGAISALTNTKTTVYNSSFMDNQSVDSGGAIHATAFNTLSVVGSNFSGNNITTTAANLGGGAIRFSGKFNSAYIGTSDFIGNASTAEAGAVMVSSTGDIDSPKPVMIEDTQFKDNTATGVNAQGGAISVGNATGQTAVTISRSSFISNRAPRGGAIYLAGGNGNQMAVDNSTFYDNRSTATFGGAIALNAGADAALNHVTLLQNIATGNGGGVRVENAGSVLAMKNSLVIDNTGATGANISNAGTYTDQGYNLIGYGASSGLFTGGGIVIPALPSKVATATSIDAIVKPALSDYSGLHKSIALTETSEARDAIPNGTNGCVTDEGYDERGFDRPDLIDVTDPDQKNDVRKCDIGAFEFNNAYRLDCYAEDGLRPDQGSGYGYYYCEDGTKPTAAELVNNIFVGRIDYYTLLLMLMLGLGRWQQKRSRQHAV